MSIAFLCRDVSDMKLFGKSFRHTITQQGCDLNSEGLFLLYLLGLAAVLLGMRFLPNGIERAAGQLSFCWLLYPMACSLLAGSTILGLYLIPSCAFVFGAVFALCSYRGAAAALISAETLPQSLCVWASVPAFFLIAALSARTSERLLCALRLAGRRTEREAIRSFFLRWAIFVGFLLCLFFLHGNRDR